MSEALRFGLIGCGGQGGYLSEAAALTGRAELVACVDLDAARAEQFAAQFGYAQWYGSAAEMLDKAGLDAVIVATSHDQLQPAALDAVRAGKHVLVEKPMALNAADGQALMEAAHAADVRLMVGYTLRFQPERREMRRLLDAGAVGEIAQITGGQLIGRLGGWLGDRARGGGPLFYVGSHALDFILWMAGRPVERVFAEVIWAEDSSVELDVAATLRFAGGITGQLLTSQRMGGRYGWCDVIGSAGRLRTVWESPEIYVESRALPEYAMGARIEVPADAHHPGFPPDARARLSGFKYVRSWGAEIGEFIDAIIEGRDPSPSGEDGVRVLQVTDAIFRSAETGCAVEV